MAWFSSQQGSHTGEEVTPGSLFHTITHGSTEEYGYEAVEGKVHIHDWHATLLHLMGLEHTRLTYRYAGRDMRRTDVKGEVVKDILELRLRDFA